MLMVRDEKPALVYTCVTYSLKSLKKKFQVLNCTRCEVQRCCATSDSLGGGAPEKPPTRELVLVQELHLQLLSGPLSQEVGGGVGRVSGGTHHICPAEDQRHGLQHVGRHHGRAERLCTHKTRLKSTQGLFSALRRLSPRYGSHEGSTPFIKFFNNACVG